MRLRFGFLVLVLALGSSVSDAQIVRKRSAAPSPEAQPSPPVYQAPQPQPIAPPPEPSPYPTQCPAEAQRISVAVYPVKPAGAGAELAAAMTALLTSKLTPSPKLKVIEEAMLKTVMERQAMNVSDACDDTSCQVEIGKLVQAQKLITGDLTKFGSKHILSLKLIDIQTGATEFATEDQCACPEDQLDNLVAIAAAKVRNHFCDQVPVPGLVAAPVQPAPTPAAPAAQYLAPAADPAQMATLYAFYNPAAHLLPPAAITTMGVVLLDGQRIGALNKEAPCLRTAIPAGAHVLTNQNSNKNLSFTCAPQQSCYVLIEISGWAPPFRYTAVSAAEAAPWIQNCQQAASPTGYSSPAPQTSPGTRMKKVAPR